MTRPARGIAVAACLAALAAATAGCGSGPPARSSSTAVAVPAVPLGTSVTTAAGTWAVVVMGGPAAQHDNFWQLFIRPSGSTRWKLVTPPGTADNGGLVLAGGSGQALTTAFRPSQYLTYTPLTQTSDAGHAWSGLSPLDAALASTPDSLATQPRTGRLLALLDSGAAEQSAPGGASWTTLISARALAATPAGRSCGLRALTAVTYSPAGMPLLGGTCTRPGVAGILAAAGHAWRAAGPALSGPLARQPVTVLRLSSTGSQTAALLAAGAGRRAALVAAWSAGSRSRWTVSPPLMTGGHAVAAASFGPGQTAAVIMAGGRGAVLAQGRWRLLPALPPATAALAPSADGTTDALAVHRASLTVWQLASNTGWTREQAVSVPIQYGSSG
jgi:hypothetical protein